MATNYDLSIVILSFNVKHLLIDCLQSIFDNQTKEIKYQVIVVDNASTDDSVAIVKKKFPQVELIQSEINLGFSAGNNLAIPSIKSDYVLFLNPDTIIIEGAIQKTFVTLQSDPKIGAVGCRVELPDGRLDYSCHRGFPTPWYSLTYFTGLSKLFPKLKLFSGYTATYLDIDTTHEIDCITGAFLMVRKQAAEQINWWDNDYFWNGEDIEFCYSLKQKGWKIYYLAEARIIHFKGSSSGLQKTGKSSASIETKIRSAQNGARAMRIFFMKHYYKSYPPIFREFVLLGIFLLEQFRLFKIRQGLKI